MLAFLFIKIKLYSAKDHNIHEIVKEKLRMSSKFQCCRIFSVVQGLELSLVNATVPEK